MSPLNYSGLPEDPESPASQQQYQRLDANTDVMGLDYVREYGKFMRHVNDVDNFVEEIPNAEDVLENAFRREEMAFREMMLPAIHSANNADASTRTDNSAQLHSIMASGSLHSISPGLTSCHPGIASVPLMAGHSRVPTMALWMAPTEGMIESPRAIAATRRHMATGTLKTVLHQDSCRKFRYGFGSGDHSSRRVIGASRDCRHAIAWWNGSRRKD
jgi:hypothetical protein